MAQEGAMRMDATYPCQVQVFPLGKRLTNIAQVSTQRIKHEISSSILSTLKRCLDRLATRPLPKLQLLCEMLFKVV